METPGFLPMARLQTLIDTLIDDGFRCVAPQVRDGAILYDTLDKVKQLPKGVTQEQSNGRYRLHQTDSTRNFAWANGPQAIKPLTFAPREELWYSEVKSDGSLKFYQAPTETEPVAILGVRACDLAALALQDQHFQHSFPDPYYDARRKRLLLIAVHCTHPAETCFCASTGDGPEARSGYDLSLYETDLGYFVTAGSLAGEMLLHRLPLEAGDAALFAAARGETGAAADAQQRQLPEGDLQAMLFGNLNHPQWQAVAERCLSCGNCTQVCPTCFCHSENSVPSISGQSTAHERQWDSCFSPGHSYIHGITLRKDTASRYRQWLTHKFGSWHEQYGRSGCVGCGRCISWCPVGIDPTEELAVICKDSAGDSA
ncbi:4Fe-4S dicluster domain-containing protein [Marinobacterium sp. D7]|nr:4Fe-4S dicluster domain-containing protein [Marinobacterium ramblicola]